MDRIIEFFKEMGFYDEEYFNKIKTRTLVVNKDYEEIKDLVGFYPDTFKLVLPKLETLKDMVIYIHEYSHALFPEDDDEIFPSLMEAYFINKYIGNAKIRENFKLNTKREIELSKDLEHTIAKKIKLKAIH